MREWPAFTVAELQAKGILLVEDGNHGEYRPRPGEFVEGGTAYIRAADLSNGQVRFDAAGCINDVAIARIRKGVGRPGDVLFSHKGTVGKLARVPLGSPPFICSPQTTLWRVLDESSLRRDYLFAYMRSRPFIDQWWARKGDTDMADYVSLTAQRQMRVVVPPIDVQRRIAEPLAAIDDLIENNRRRAEVLQEMARAIYREWFVRFRYPRHEDVPLVESPLGPIPDGWSVRRLGDISVNFDRHRRPLSKAQRQQRRGSIPYYGAAKLIDWIDGWIFDGEYLLFAEDGSVQTQDGYPMLQLVEGKFWANNHTHILQGSGVSTRFLYLASAVQSISGFVTGAAQPKITQANLNRIQLIVATPDVQRSFDGLINPVFDEWRQVQSANGPLSALRDVLLSRLVTGQIDVSLLGRDGLAEAAFA